MWEYIIGRFPTTMIISCTALAFGVPVTIYKINQLLHHHGDPPWKKKSGKKDR
ncbi:hypothetical protein ACFS6F_10305 [Halobacillus naozhouensis]|uniref:hypothetical protein n=1 Tax=Halobacillus naozhouensis TaxID=554880 RepID=UPI0036379B6F